MDILSKQELKLLVDNHKPPCISIYMPAIRAGAEIQQNPIRFKNLLRITEQNLRDRGLRTLNVEEFLKPAYELLDNKIFWQNQSDCLALFTSPDLFKQYRLTLDCNEIAIVANSFHIKPLMPLIYNTGRFYILAISQDEVRLLKGTRFAVDEVNLEGVPKSLAEALRWDDPEKQLQHHTGPGAPTGGSRPYAIYHGHAAGAEAAREKKDILRYFHKVDRGLKELLADEQAPLILAGVEYLFPIYLEANSYNYLIEEGIPGNPEGLSAGQLQEQALKILEPYSQEELEKAVALYQQQAGMQTGRATDDLAQIIQSAYEGRIGQLFIQRDIEKWGIYDLTNNRIEYQEGSTGENQDLLDVAAIQTFLNGGLVYLVEAHEMPVPGPVAAVLRY